MLRGRRVTGLEPAPGKLIAVEVTPAAISRAAVIEVPPDGLERLPLKPALSRSGVNPSPIHLVTWDSEQIHRTLLLPPMSATERSLFLERELAREGGGAKAIGSQVLRQVEDGTRKEEVLTVAASREGLDRILAPFLAARLAPRLVATAPVALVRAALALSPIPADQPTIIAHWGLSGLTVAVVADGVLKLARQIPRLAVSGLDPLEWVATEIQRSVQHYAQVSRGRRVEQLLVGNADGALEPVFSDSRVLEARLGLTVLSLNQALRPLLPDGVEEEAELPAGAFLLPFGAALLDPQEAPNLLPREMVIGQRSRQVTRAALAAAALLAFTLGGSFWAASREAAAVRRTLEQQRAAQGSLHAKLGEAERVRAERERVRHWIQMLSEDPLGGPPMADVLKEVSRLVPDQLRLERLVISKGEGGYTLKLVGSVKQADLAEAQAAFNRFYFGLRDSPLFYEVTFLPEAEKKEGVQVVVEGRPREAVKAAEQQLAFDLTLRLKGVR